MMIPVIQNTKPVRMGETTMRFHVLCLVMLLFIVPDPVGAALDVETVSKSIVRVRAYDNNRVTGEGAGFVINEKGHVLTHAHLLRGADRISVISLDTGAEILAQQTFSDRDLNLAVLEVPGLAMPSLSLSEQGIDVGRTVLTLTLTPDNELLLSRGTIGAHDNRKVGREPDAVTAHLLHHNAMISAAAFGMPLFNECEQVVAVNLPDPDTVNWLFSRVKDPENAVFALRTADIITKLSEWEIAHTVVDEVCLSAVARAEQSAKEKAEQAEAERQAAEAVQQQLEAERQAAEAVQQQLEAERQTAEAAKQQLEAEKAALEAVQQQAEAAKRAADDARQQLEEEKQVSQNTLQLKQEEIEAVEEEKRAAQAAREEAVAEVEVAQQERLESSQLLKQGALVGAVLVILALLGWFLTSRHKKRSLAAAAQRLQEAEQEAEVARQAAADAPQPAPFRCLLEGKDDTGQPFALSIPALALGDPAGVVVGRNPANAEFIINNEAISREHVRLTCTGGELQVEDLDTTNGTRINGRQLSPGISTLLQDNDQLELGPVRLTVRLL